jgi:hypothetical protein
VSAAGVAQSRGGRTHGEGPSWSWRPIETTGDGVAPGGNRGNLGGGGIKPGAAFSGLACSAVEGEVWIWAGAVALPPLRSDKDESAAGRTAVDTESRPGAAALTASLRTGGPDAAFAWFARQSQVTASAGRLPSLEAAQSQPPEVPVTACDPDAGASATTTARANGRTFLFRSIPSGSSRAGFWMGRR